LRAPTAPYCWEVPLNIARRVQILHLSRSVEDALSVMAPNLLVYGQGVPVSQTIDTVGPKAPSVMAADKLTGNRVVNRHREHLGSIEHLMIDLECGRVAYAVLSFGGFLGIRDKLFAIPWSALAIDLPERQFVLDVDKTLLEGAPGFDKAHWPDMADRAWGMELLAYWGADSYWAQRAR